MVKIGALAFPGVNGNSEGLQLQWQQPATAFIHSGGLTVVRLLSKPPTWRSTSLLLMLLTLEVLSWQ